MPERGYTLVVPVVAAGFFSNVNRVVCHLRHTLGRGGCEALRVDWRPSELLPELGFGRPGDGELWSHFFEPLDFPDAPGEEVAAGWEFPDWSMTGLNAYRMYKRGDRWRAAYGSAFAEHVRVRPLFRERAGRLRSPAGDAFCVGVHYRHPLHDYEEPRAAEAIDYFVERTARLAAPGRELRVVLATDYTEAAERFAAAFGPALVLQPGVGRAGIGEDQYHHTHAAVEIGEQALVDALALASCDVVLHSVSNLATAVGYMNPAVRMVFCERPLVGTAATVRARLLPRFRRPGPAGLSRSRPRR